MAEKNTKPAFEREKKEDRARVERQSRPDSRLVEGEAEGRDEPLIETTFADLSESGALSEETRMDFLAGEANVRDEAVMNEIARHTDDPEVLEDFAERQNFNSGSQRLYERLTQHHSESPDLSAEDIDAAWEDANQSGEESVGGTVPTPDQDIVEELGEAVGLDYDDDEPLGTFDKISERDIHRYELDPETMRDMAGEQVPVEDTPYADSIEDGRLRARLQGAEVGREDPFAQGKSGLAESDSLDEDADALGDASFPQETGDENTDEDYL